MYLSSDEVSTISLYMYIEISVLRIIGYCSCMGIYCVERVLLAELPELARATTPKERVQHIYSHTSAITFLLYTLKFFT